MKLAESILEELWFAEDADEDAGRQASHSLAAKLASTEGMKTFPAVAQKILAIFSDSNYRVSQVTRALEEDPSLAAGVLRMANSAFFAPVQPIVQIDQAFVRIGARHVKEIVCALSTMGLFKNASEVGMEVRDHCASVAALAQYVEREFNLNCSEGLFLGALLHDMGKLLLLETREVFYSQVQWGANEHHLMEREQLGYDHAVLAAHIVTGWHFGDEVSRLIAWHHQPVRAFADAQMGKKVAILRLADKIDYQLVATIGDEADEGAVVDERVLLKELNAAEECAVLGLSSEDVIERWATFYRFRMEALSTFAGVV